MAGADESDEDPRIRDGDDSSYGLEERTFRFAKDIRAWVRRLPVSIAHQEDVRQLVRASGSVGANFIEAVESLSKKDFGYRVKVCRKEAKESRYWLRLLSVEDDPSLEERRRAFVQEASELMNIFGAIVRKNT